MHFYYEKPDLVVRESKTQNTERKKTEATARQQLMEMFLFTHPDMSCRALYAIARPSVCLSVCHTGGSVKDG